MSAETSRKTAEPCKTQGLRSDKASTWTREAAVSESRQGNRTAAFSFEGMSRGVVESGGLRYKSWKPSQNCGMMECMVRATLNLRL